MPAGLRSTLGRLRYDGLLAGSPTAYLFAVACVAAAGVAHFAFAHFFNYMSPSVPYYPAIFVAALFAGRRAGITAAVLSAVVIWWAIDTHYFGQHVSALTRGVNRGLYATAAILVIWVADGYRCAGHARGPPAETAPARADTQASGTNGRAARRWLLPEGWHDRLVPNSLAAYGFAVAAVATATLVRFGVGWLDGDVLPFACYYPAILIVCLIGGVEAGLFAMMLSMVAAWCAFLAHHESAGFPKPDEFVSLALYLFASLLTVWLAENYRRPIHAREPTLVEFIAPVVVSLAAVLLTTVVLFMIDSYLAAQHLVLGYLLPTVLIAIYYGSTIAVLATFVSGLAAAYVLFPPKFSFYVANPMHIAELGFFMLLAVIASKAVSVLTDDIRGRRRGALRNRGH